MIGAIGNLGLKEQKTAHSLKYRSRCLGSFSFGWAPHVTQCPPFQSVSQYKLQISGRTELMASACKVLLLDQLAVLGIKSGIDLVVGVLSKGLLRWR